MIDEEKGGRPQAMSVYNPEGSQSCRKNVYGFLVSGRPDERGGRRPGFPLLVRKEKHTLQILLAYRFRKNAIERYLNNLESGT